MLAAAVNYLGSSPKKTMGSCLLKIFSDFKLIELSPGDDFDEGRLQLCQPQGYEDLMKSVQIVGNLHGSQLELRGPKAKLQRVIRHMLYFDQEKSCTQVFLEGSEGIKDFPWAIQIVLIQLPVTGMEYESEMMRKADILVISGFNDDEREAYLEKTKKTYPKIPAFAERLEEGLSPEVTECLEKLWAAYLDTRKKIKDKLELEHPDLLISCARAHKLAKELRVSSFLLGSVCDELGYRITNCWLGFF